MYLVAAILFAFLGIRGIFNAWHCSAPPSSHLLNTAFLLLSLTGWCLFAGAEFGSVAWLASIALIALIFTFAHGRLSPCNDEPAKPVKYQSPSLRSVLYNVRQFVLILPLAGVASLALTMGVVSLAGFSRTNEMVTGMLLIPFSWGVLAYWSSSQPAIWRALTGLCGAGLLGSAGLVL